MNINCQGRKCCICEGYFPLFGNLVDGLCLFRDKKYLQDFGVDSEKFICYECVIWLQEAFNRHISSLAYNLLTKNKDATHKKEEDKK